MADNTNGIEMILKKIREYGDETARELIDDARRRAEELLNEAKQRSSDFIKEEESSLSGASERFESQAETDFAAVKRDKTLSLKQEMLSKTYSRAAELLAQLPDEKRLSLYRKWIRAYGEDTDYSVVLNKRDRDAFGDILSAEMSRGEFPGHASLSAFSAEITGGVILDFGDSRTDISFDSVVESEKGKYDAELIGILFPEG